MNPVKVCDSVGLCLITPGAKITEFGSAARNDTETSAIKSASEHMIDQIKKINDQINKIKLLKSCKFIFLFVCIK